MYTCGVPAGGGRLWCTPVVPLLEEGDIGVHLWCHCWVAPKECLVSPFSRGLLSDLGLGIG